MVQADWPAPVPQVTLPGYAAAGFGPMRTSPRFGDVEESNTETPPTEAESITLKLADLTLKVAAPVFTVIGPAPLARGVPPKSPLPVSVSVTVAVVPAPREGMIPQTLTHFARPDGHFSIIRNCPADAPVKPRAAVLKMPAPSAIGAPTQNGSSVLAIPADPPGYIAS